MHSKHFWKMIHIVCALYDKSKNLKQTVYFGPGCDSATWWRHQWIKMYDKSLLFPGRSKLAIFPGKDSDMYPVSICTKRSGILNEVYRVS